MQIITVVFLAVGLKKIGAPKKIVAGCRHLSSDVIIMLTTGNMSIEGSRGGMVDAYRGNNSDCPAGVACFLGNGFKCDGAR